MFKRNKITKILSGTFVLFLFFQNVLRAENPVDCFKVPFSLSLQVPTNFTSTEGIIKMALKRELAFVENIEELNLCMPSLWNDPHGKGTIKVLLHFDTKKRIDDIWTVSCEVINAEGEIKIYEAVVQEKEPFEIEYVKFKTRYFQQGKVSQTVDKEEIRRLISDVAAKRGLHIRDKDGQDLDMDSLIELISIEIGKKDTLLWRVYAGNMLHYAQDLTNYESQAFLSLLKIMKYSYTTYLFRHEFHLEKLKEITRQRIQKALALAEDAIIEFKVFVGGVSKGHELASVITVILEVAEEMNCLDLLKIEALGIDINSKVLHIAENKLLKDGYKLRDTNSGEAGSKRRKKLSRINNYLARIRKREINVNIELKNMTLLELEDSVLQNADFVFLNVVLYLLNEKSRREFVSRLTQMKPGAILFSNHAHYETEVAGISHDFIEISGVKRENNAFSDWGSVLQRKALSTSLAYKKKNIPTKIKTDKKAPLSNSYYAQLLRNISDPDELSLNLREILIAITRTKRDKIVLAFSENIGDKQAIRLIKELDKLLDNTGFRKFIGNRIDIVVSKPEELQTRIDGCTKDSKNPVIFMFAPLKDKNDGLLKDIKAGVQSVFIDESEFFNNNRNMLAEGYYYPIVDIVVLTLVDYYKKGAIVNNIQALFKELKIGPHNTNIKKTRRDKTLDALIFKIIPKAVEYDIEGLPARSQRLQEAMIRA